MTAELTQITLSEYHSPQQHKDIRLAARVFMGQPQVQRKLAYLVLVELAKYADPLFPDMLDYLDRHDSNPRTAAFRQTVALEYQKVKEVLATCPPAFLRQFEQDLLTPNKPMLMRGTDPAKPLIVVFTTMFNNFYLSNLALSALLLDRGYSVLLLKDSSGYQYLNGIPGLGATWDATIARIGQIAGDEGRGVVVTGFSSGGYAAGLAALALRPQLYVGFSISGNLSPDTDLPMPKLFTAENRAQTPAGLRRDLVPEFRETGQPARLFAGTKSLTDLAHIRAFDGVAHVEQHVMDNEGHVTIRPLFMTDRLTDCFVV